MLGETLLANCIGGVALILVAIFFLVLFKKALTKTLPLNCTTGLRTRNTMSSDIVWNLVHHRYAWIFLISSMGFIISGLALLIDVFVPGWHIVLIKIFYFSLAISLVLVIAGGIGADRYARSIRELKE